MLTDFLTFLLSIFIRLKETNQPNTAEAEVVSLIKEPEVRAFKLATLAPKDCSSSQGARKKKLGEIYQRIELC